MAKAQLDFSGARGIIDPLEGLRASMQQTSSNLGQMIAQDETRKQQELTRARQARQDALTTPGSPEWTAAQKAQQEMKISGMGAEQKWKAENDPAYQNALAAYTRETPGTPEWKAAQSALQSMKISGMGAELDFKKTKDPLYMAQVNALNRAESERLGKEALASAVLNAPTGKLTSVITTPEQVEAARQQLASASVSNAGKTYGEESAKLAAQTVQKEILDETGYPITVGKPKFTPEEIHQEALKRAGLLDVIAGKEPKIDESKLPKIGTVTTTSKLTEPELKQAKLDAVIKAAKDKKIPATLALEIANKLTPTKTNKEKLEEAKLDLDILEFDEKKAKNYYGKSGGSGNGDWLKTLNETYKTYGDPDIIGTGDRAKIQNDLAKIQVEGTYSDADMKNAIEASMGVYANPGSLGVDRLGFVKAVGDNLLKMKNK